MNRFFVDIDGRDIGTDISITGGDVNHIRNVLRLKTGEQILVSDGRGRDYTCRISEITGEAVVCSIEDINDNFAELPVEVTLFQGYPKSDKMDLIVQKMVELGVHRIVPVFTARTIVKLDPKKAAKKTERYQTIAEAAAKQSGRGIVPEITGPVTFARAIELAKELDMNIIPYEEAEGLERSRQIIAQAAMPLAQGTPTLRKSLGIFIGPEGGFAKEEVEQAKAAGAECITLGHRILRTETAGLAVMSIIMFQADRD